MPSAAFHTFNAVALPVVLGQVQAALALGAIATRINGNVTVPGPAYGAWAGPAGLAAHLAWIQGRWNTDRSEDNRRVYIDAVIHQVLAGGGIPPALVCTCQEHIAAGGGLQLGHGFPDYLLSALFLPGTVPQWNPSIIIEAKLDLQQGGAAHDYGERQLMAMLTTASQIAAGGGLGGMINYQRGVLTDGRFWRFYELFLPAAIFRRTRHYDILVAGEDLRIFRLMRRFMINYNSNAGWLIL